MAEHDADLGNGHLRLVSSISAADTVVNHDGMENTASPQSSTFVTSPVQLPGTSHMETPTTIPPEHPFRTLICLFDGTGDAFDADNSNIVQLASILKKDDRSKQMIYYQVILFPSFRRNHLHRVAVTVLGGYRHIHDS